MKTLTFSRLLIGLSLVIGVMVFWVGASPNAMGADSIIGAWYAGPGGCCTGWNWQPCSDRTDVPDPGCTGGLTMVCILGGNGPKTCSDEGPTNCEPAGGDGEPEECDDTVLSGCE